MTVGSVVQALAILRHLSEAAKPLGVTTVARALEISPSSCFNLLRTLVAEEFVDFDATAKTYRIGGGLARLARKAEVVDAATAVARPKLEALAASWRVASGLWRLNRQGRLVLLDFVDSEHVTRIHMTVGQRLPMFIGAMGRCVAAHAGLDTERLTQEFGALRWENPPTLARYRREVAQARRSGWAIDDGDFMRGVTTIGAAIVDAGGVVRFCVANTMFRGQHDAASLERIGAETARAAEALSQALWPRPAG